MRQDRRRMELLEQEVERLKTSIRDMEAKLDGMATKPAVTPPKAEPDPIMEMAKEMYPDAVPPKRGSKGKARVTRKAKD